MDSRVPAPSPQDGFLSRRGHSDASAASAEEERLPDPANARLRHWDTLRLRGCFWHLPREESLNFRFPRGGKTLCFCIKLPPLILNHWGEKKGKKQEGGGFTPRGRATPKTGFERDATSSPVSSVTHGPHRGLFRQVTWPLLVTAVQWTKTLPSFPEKWQTHLCSSFSAFKDRLLEADRSSVSSASSPRFSLKGSAWRRVFFWRLYVLWNVQMT